MEEQFSEQSTLKEKVQELQVEVCEQVYAVVSEHYKLMREESDYRHEVPKLYQKLAFRVEKA